MKRKVIQLLLCATTMGVIALIQSQAIVTIFIMVLFVETLHFLIQKMVLQLPATKKEAEMKIEIAELQREAYKYNLPATFTKWAKLSRKANQMERDLLKMQEERNVKLREPWRAQVSKVLGFRIPVMLFFMFFIYERYLEKAPILELSGDWMKPIGRPLALPNYYSGSLSVVGWATVSQRFLARFFGAFLARS